VDNVQSHQMSGFFEEVKRRKVYRVAVAYIIAAGGIIQIASAVFPAWELPNWSLRLVIMLLLIGFPIALILAWAYDVTPQGIRATEPAANFPARRRGRRNLFILLAIGVLASAAAGFFVLPRAMARKMDKSVAVLPFENLSDDKENAYFADGIQDDILTNLAKIGDLKVISRTSVMGYRGKAASVREIGKALGVSAILEGSVRTDRKNNRVRVNVQLINAENDQHLWAEDYDRDLTDVFAIQTDLAQKIARELQAKLSPSEKAQLTRKPTENGEAYLAFVQARDLQSHVEDSQKLTQAAQLFERALQLDPNFALAIARYSQLESWLFHTYSTPGAREKARTLANRALALEPDLPEVHLALGFSHYYGEQNFDAALHEFEIAQSGLPNEMEAYLALGAIKRRQGKWAASTADLEKAAELSPQDSWPLQNLVFNYEMLRDFDKANSTVERALAINPDSFALWETKSYLAMLERGDLSVAEKALEQVKKLAQSDEKQQYLSTARAQVLLLQRKYAEALQVAENATDNFPQGLPEHKWSKQMLIGFTRTQLGDASGARPAFIKAKEIAETQLQSLPDNAGVRVHYALALAYLGEKDHALVEANRAMELQPESKDAFEGPSITQSAAQVYCAVGEHTRAIEMLDGLLSRPAVFTVEMLKLDPAWDPLRNEPVYKQLLAKYGAKT
jgi:TolB-like protein/Flp pilus assembly protein TadD